jgi:hypothetical protein
MQKYSKAKNKESSMRLDPKFRRLIYGCFFGVLCLGGLFYYFTLREESALVSRHSDAPSSLGKSLSTVPTPTGESKLSAAALPVGDQAASAVLDAAWAPGSLPPEFPELEAMANRPSTESEIFNYPDPVAVGPYAERSIGGVRSAQATVAVAGKSFALASTDGGEFPRVFVAPEQSAQISVRLPDIGTKERVLVRAEDGGAFADGETARIFVTDEQGLLQFDARTSVEAGTHRFVVVGNDQEWILDLWVGPPSPLRIPPPLTGG